MDSNGKRGSGSKRWDHKSNYIRRESRKEDFPISLIPSEQICSCLESLINRLDSTSELKARLTETTQDLLRSSLSVLKQRGSLSIERDNSKDSDDGFNSEINCLKEAVRNLELDLMEGRILFPIDASFNCHNEFITILHILIYAKEILLNTRSSKALMKRVIFSIWILILHDENTRRNSIVLFSSNMLYNIIYLLMLSYLSPRSFEDQSFSSSSSEGEELPLKELASLNPKFYKKYLSRFLDNKSNKVMEMIFIELSKQIIKKFFLIQSYAHVFMETLFRLAVQLMGARRELLETKPNEIFYIDLKFYNFVLRKFLSIINTQMKNIEAFKSLMRCEVTFKQITPMESLFRCFAFNMIRDFTGKELEIKALGPFINTSGMELFGKEVTVIVERDDKIIENQNKAFTRLLSKLLSVKELIRK